MTSTMLDDNVETPNATGTELKNTVQANKFVVQPNTYNYAQTQKPVTNTQQATTKQATTQQSNTQQATTQQPTIIQPNQQVEPIQTVVPVAKPSDFSDSTVEGYLADYEYGVKTNNYQMQINALGAIDNYRTSKGYSAMYSDNIYELMNQRTNKINNQISQYENEIAYANARGDYSTVEQLGKELEAYKRSVNYVSNPNNSATYLATESYKSDYDSVINGIVNELLTMRFTYNPNEDEALMRAQEYAVNTAYESMNRRGILDSTMTAQIVTSTIANLQYQYEKMARDEFYENVDRMMTMANFIVKLDDRQYDMWKDNVSFNLQRYEAIKDEMSYQWQRVEQLGYVDNTASVILGVPVGTLSASTRKAIQEAENDKEKEYNKLMSDIALAEAKAQINAQYDMQTYAYQKAVDNQYNDNTTASKGIKNDAGVYLPVDSSSKFTGSLKADTIIDAIYKMNQEDAIRYARENANSHDTWVQVLNKLELTEDEANEILTSNSVDQTMDYVDGLLADGTVSFDDWKEWYERNELDWIDRTRQYKIVKTEMDRQYSKEAATEVLKDAIKQGLDKQIAERLFDELEEDYSSLLINR